jgi:HEAT repeat protein
MRSEDEQVRLAAAFALLKIDKNPDAVIVVTSLLSENTEGGLFFSGPRGALMAESSRSMSAEATKILGELGPAAKSALPALRKLLSSKDESLQKAAREAIRKIEEPETKP